MDKEKIFDLLSNIVNEHFPQRFHQVGFLRDEKGIYGYGIGNIVDNVIINNKKYNIIECEQGRVILRTDKISNQIILERQIDFIDTRNIGYIKLFLSKYDDYNNVPKSSNLMIHVAYTIAKHIHNIIQLNMDFIKLSFNPSYEIKYKGKSEKTIFESYIKSFVIKYTGNILYDYIKICNEICVDRNIMNIVNKVKARDKYALYQIMSFYKNKKKSIENVHVGLYVLEMLRNSCCKIAFGKQLYSPNINKMHKDFFQSFLFPFGLNKEYTYKFEMPVVLDMEYNALKNTCTLCTESDFHILHLDKRIFQIEFTTIDKIFTRQDISFFTIEENKKYTLFEQIIKKESASFNNIVKAKKFEKYMLKNKSFVLFNEQKTHILDLSSKLSFFMYCFRNGYIDTENKKSFRKKDNIKKTAFYKKYFLRSKILSDFFQSLSFYNKNFLDKTIKNYVFFEYLFGQKFVNFIEQHSSLAFYICSKTKVTLFDSLDHEINFEQDIYFKALVSIIFENKKTDKIYKEFSINKTIAFHFKKYPMIWYEFHEKKLDNFINSYIHLPIFKDINGCINFLKMARNFQIFYVNEQQKMRDVIFWIIRNMQNLHSINHQDIMYIREWIDISYNTTRFNNIFAEYPHIRKFEKNINLFNACALAREIHQLENIYNINHDNDGYIYSKEKFHIVPVCNNVISDEKKFIFIESPYDLYVEGKNMRHCVSSYIDKVQNGNSQIYHIEFKQELATLEIDINKDILQLYGVCNNVVSKDLKDYVNTILYQR